MHDTESPTREADATACQRRCARTRGCAHFSFWKLGGHCHLQDAFAIEQKARIGFISGPFQCWDNIDQKLYVKLGPKTFVPKALRCVETGSLYSPIMGVPKYLPKHSMTGLKAVEVCQQHCSSVKGCLHFTLQFPQRLCRLAGANAHRLPSAINSVSGPRFCNGTKEKGGSSDSDLLIIRRDEVPLSAMQRIGAAGSGFLLAVIGIVVAAILTSVVGMLLRHVRRDVARGEGKFIWRKTRPKYSGMPVVSPRSPDNLLVSNWAAE